MNVLPAVASVKTLLAEPAQVYSSQLTGGTPHNLTGNEDVQTYFCVSKEGQI